MASSGIAYPLAFGFLYGGFFAAGLLLISIPIIIHILNRRRFKTVTWAAMHFLLAAMKKNRRRLQFEHWVLLATRCLLLALLGAALARPLGCNQAVFGMGHRSALNVIIINNSYSMGMAPDGAGGKTYLQQAKRLAQEFLDDPTNAGCSTVVLSTARLPVEDQAAATAAERPTYDLQTARDQVDRIAQTYASSDLLGAMQRALAVGRSVTDQQDKNLILITDATRSAWEGADSTSIKEMGPQLAAMFKISHFSLSQGRAQWNDAIFGLKPTDSLVTNKYDTSLKVDARNFGAGRPATIHWRKDDELLGSPTPLSFDATAEGQTLNQVRFATGGPHVVSATLDSGDALPIDDTFYRVIDVASQLKTLIVEGKHGMSALEGSGAYLQIALAPQKDVGLGKPPQTDSYIVPELVSDLEFPDKALGDYRAVVLTDVQQIAPAVAKRLQEFVQQGGTLMIFMGDAVDRESYNSTLLPLGLMPGPLIERKSVQSDQPGFHFDFNPKNVTNPLLHDFANQEDTGLDRAQVFTYWQADVPASSPAERVLNYQPPAGKALAPGVLPDPAITVQSNKLGRVVFFSTTASPEWTDLPQRRNFLPLMQALLSGSVRAGDSWMNLEIGNKLAIPPTVRLASAPSLLDPDQRPILLEPDLDKASGNTIYHSPELLRPGVYTLNTGDRNIPIAVKVPADREADVRTVTDDRLREDLGGVNVAMHGATLPTEATAAEGNDWGWWCLAIVLMLAALECFLAMRFGHHRLNDLSGLAGAVPPAGRGASSMSSVTPARGDGIPPLRGGVAPGV
jgi:hypothetical protein